MCAPRAVLWFCAEGRGHDGRGERHFLHAARIAMRVPSVIRLLEYRRIPHQSRALSRKNILLRDRNTCQYCATVLPSGELTLDHVVPRSRGGSSTWENLVACCHTCNRRKGNQFPLEAGMKLMREPAPSTSTPAGTSCGSWDAAMISGGSICFTRFQGFRVSRFQSGTAAVLFCLMH